MGLFSYDNGPDEGATAPLNSKANKTFEGWFYDDKKKKKKAAEAAKKAEEEKAREAAEEDELEEAPISYPTQPRQSHSPAKAYKKLAKKLKEDKRQAANYSLSASIAKATGWKQQNVARALIISIILFLVVLPITYLAVYISATTTPKPVQLFTGINDLKAGSYVCSNPNDNTVKIWIENLDGGYYKYNRSVSIDSKQSGAIAIESGYKAIIADAIEQPLDCQPR